MTEYETRSLYHPHPHSTDKFEYIENGTIFFQRVRIEIYQTLAYVTYIKASQIGDNSLIVVRVLISKLTVCLCVCPRITVI